MAYSRTFSGFCSNPSFEYRLHFAIGNLALVKGKIVTKYDKTVRDVPQQPHYLRKTEEVVLLHLDYSQSARRENFQQTFHAGRFSSPSFSPQKHIVCRITFDKLGGIPDQLIPGKIDSHEVIQVEQMGVLHGHYFPGILPFDPAKGYMVAEYAIIFIRRR